jgi:nickel-dependent lactate racemase
MTDDAARERAIQILVRSLYRDLKAQGYDDKHIVAVAIELLGKVTDELSIERMPRRA